MGNTAAQNSPSSLLPVWLLPFASAVLFATGLLLDHAWQPSWFTGLARGLWYAVAYLPVGWPVLAKGVTLALRGDFFTEFMLMSVATIGAFYIREYPEGVAVMLFYTVGELLQDAAVHRAKRSIQALLDVRPKQAWRKRGDQVESADPVQVEPGEIILVKPGERVPLDGTMLSDGSTFNTAALTGEPAPRPIARGETVLAGMINEDRAVEITVTQRFNDSSLARILTLVQNAQGRKAKTELFIRKFARVYTPIVFLLALGVLLIPYLFVDVYHFDQWLYRALVFLVVSCPCALVVAIPLGYIGGIGAASRHGILFKGSTYLDQITRTGTVVLDKTGTLTRGVFRVKETIDAGTSPDWIALAAALEGSSTHPTARAIAAYAPLAGAYSVENAEEIKGHGMKGVVQGKQVLAGNLKLLQRFGISVAPQGPIEDTVVAVAVEGKLAGYLLLGDELKDDSAQTVNGLHASGIEVIMLSGDRQVVVDRVAQQLHIKKAFGDLLPEQKVEKLEAIKKGKKTSVVFVGDGINDAPVLALSDIGIAMGGLGSDAAIETADVIIQTDQPSRLLTAIRIGQATQRIVWQNIGFAFTVKVIVLLLGAGGVATLWEAAFADAGVALLAILNAARIQRKRF